jgi:hypothetical protein
MGIFFPFQAAGFQFGADDAQRTDAGVAHIREDHFTDAAGGDHLVGDQVGGGAGDDQVFASLPDDFMPGSKGNQMGEPGRIDQVAIFNELLHCFGQREDFAHGWNLLLYDPGPGNGLPGPGVERIRRTPYSTVVRICSRM